ncbi:hypothetical protein V565_098700 [Rhizoctonia solani 123E]|uniref:Uncharacterized protein n=1 Tax=Rhizoctonia solani 123E TaxID=1423351 RepID=A0A074RR10_9AGAM|nr:hypothetical protein V565_098700 [Rhizoctonia solani 123E]
MVEELEEHVKNVSRYKFFTKADKRRVTFGNQLQFYPCDMQPGNFKKGAHGEVVPLDFGTSCFMPPCILICAMRKPVSDFACWLSQLSDFERHRADDCRLRAPMRKNKYRLVCLLSFSANSWTPGLTA